MTKDWYIWTIGEIEDNLNLLQAQAVDYLREPFECDCFLKHTSIIRGYANEMQSFAKTDQERELLSRLAAWSDKWHLKFEGKKQVPKEVMQSLHDETREMRKEVEDLFFMKERRLGKPRSDEERRERHLISHGSAELPPRGTGLENPGEEDPTGSLFDAALTEIQETYQKKIEKLYKELKECKKLAGESYERERLCAEQFYPAIWKLEKERDDKIEQLLIESEGKDWREKIYGKKYVERWREKEREKEKSNPTEAKHVLECKGGVCECVIRGHAVGHFDPKSFRTMKDYPKKGYYMIVGCPKGQFRAGKCQVGTELHKIIAPMDRCR